MKKNILIDKEMKYYTSPLITSDEILLEEGLAANSTTLNPVDPSAGVDVEDWTDDTIDHDFNW